MNKNEKKELVLKLHHIWNTSEFELIPEVYAENFVVHWPRGFKSNESHGHAEVQETITMIKKGIPDWFEDVKDIVVGEDDKVVTRYTSTGTHLGLYAGVEATGKPISLDEISIYRIENGKIAEQWCLSDDTSTLFTLGILTEKPNM